MKTRNFTELLLQAPSVRHSGSFHKFFKTKTGHNEIKNFKQKTYSNFDSLGSAFPKMTFPVQNRNYEYHHRI